MGYSIKFTEEAKNSLHNLHIDNQTKIKSVLKDLSKNLQLGKQLIGRLSGFYSLRIGKYRAIYTIERETIIVHYVGHRKEVYEKAEKEIN